MVVIVGVDESGDSWNALRAAAKKPAGGTLA